MMSAEKQPRLEGASLENSILNTRGPNRRVLVLGEVPGWGTAFEITMRWPDGPPQHASPSFYITNPEGTYLISLGALYNHDYEAPGEPREGVYGLSCFTFAAEAQGRGCSGKYPVITPPGDIQRIAGISAYEMGDEYTLRFEFSSLQQVIGKVTTHGQTLTARLTGSTAPNYPIDFPLTFPLSVRCGHFEREMLSESLYPYLSFTAEEAFNTLNGCELISTRVVTL